MTPLRRTNFLYFLYGFIFASFIFFIQSTYISDSNNIRHLKIINDLKKGSKELLNPGKSNQKKSEEENSLLEEQEKAREEQHEDDEDQHNQNEGMFQHEHGESEVSQALKQSVRVLCWIMTGLNNTESRAIHVNATWAPRCNKYVFITSKPGYGLPTVDLNVTEGRNYLWAKTKAAFQWIYENEIDNYDWFMKADDDTYVIVENLRFMLLAYSPNDPVYFGCKFKPFTKQGYMSGGSGYVLSREAVKRFVTEAIPDPKKCKEKGTGAEDAEIGKCLENVNVIAGDSRDSQGRHRMLPFSPLSHLQAGGNKTMPVWFYKYMFYPYEQGKECCSDYMISFHYVNKGTMYALDNLLYHIKPFGFYDDYWASESKKNSDKETIDVLKILAEKNSMPIKQEKVADQK
jgi:hypothetical protein